MEVEECQADERMQKFFNRLTDLKGKIRNRLMYVRQKVSALEEEENFLENLYIEFDQTYKVRDEDPIDA